MSEIEDHDFIESLPDNSGRIIHPDEPLPPKQPRKLDKVTKNVVKIKKPSFIDRFAQTFFGGDARSVATYVVVDILIPTVKTTVLEMINTGAEMMVWGESKGSSRIHRQGTKTKVSYQNYWDKPDRSERDENRIRTRQKFDDVIIRTRGEAEEVLSILVDAIDEYGEVTVGDFYDAVGIKSEFEDQYWGWTNLGSAEVRRGRDGYYLLMPRARQLKD